MDIYTIFFILFILAMAVVYYLLHRSEDRTKDKCKITAYNLLEEKNPDPKKIKATLRLLNLYGGRWRRDQEFEQLIKLLAALLDEVEGKSAISESKIRK
jgi:hypothetical protein